jgi:maleate isomerase
VVIDRAENGRPDPFARDGWDADWRIGLLVPHADVGPEAELQAMAPPAVTIHAMRVRFGAMASGGAMDPTIPLVPVRAFAESPELDAAAELLAMAPLDVIAFGFTSSAYVIGADGETAMTARLEHSTRGIPVVAASAATSAALRELGVRRVALVTPPWFDAELTALGRRYFQNAGHDVVSAASAGLQSDQRSITRRDLLDWICKNTPDAAEVVVIAGNGLRAVGVISVLEHALARPVVTANQALLWAALRAVGADATAVRGYGVLFTTAPRTSTDDHR